MSEQSMQRAGLKQTIAAWGPAIAGMAIIFILSAQPRLPVPLPFPGFDKLMHAAAYLGLALLAFRGAVLLPLTKTPGPYAQSLCLAALYGLSDEFHQSFVPGRSADALDWLADVLGAVVALLIVVVLRNRLARGGK